MIIGINWSKEDDAYLASCKKYPSIMVHGKTQISAIEELLKVLKVLKDIKDK